MELHDGDIIVFKDIVNVSINENIDININFNVNSSSWNYISIRNYNTTQALRTNDIRYYYGEYQGQMVFNGANDSWYDSSYKTIIIRGNQTITDENAINWLYENTVSGLPVREMEQSYQGTNNFLTATVTNIGQIINPVISNPVTGIFTIGIFLISIAVGILHRLRRKTF